MLSQIEACSSTAILELSITKFYTKKIFRGISKPSYLPKYDMTFPCNVTRSKQDASTASCKIRHGECRNTAEVRFKPQKVYEVPNGCNIAAYDRFSTHFVNKETVYKTH